MNTSSSLTGLIRASGKWRLLLGGFLTLLTFVGGGEALGTEFVAVLPRLHPMHGSQAGYAQDSQSRKVGIRTTSERDTGERSALVIGNGAYPNHPLRNPVNDASDVATALREVGFTVILKTNQTQAQMKREMREFGNALRPGKVGLFFYAGHGTQVEGENFLIPVDADITREEEVELEAVNVNEVLKRMGGARSLLNVLILDACRNNPFERSFRSMEQGLALVSAFPGTAIAYATAPGRTASDGAEANGVYTAELVKAIRQPGLELVDVFKETHKRVQERTKGAQVPWYHSSVVIDFYFKSPTEIAADEKAWEYVKTSDNPAFLDDFLSRYPTSIRAPEARALRSRLMASSTNKPPVTLPEVNSASVPKSAVGSRPPTSFPAPPIAEWLVRAEESYRRSDIDGLERFAGEALHLDPENAVALRLQGEVLRYRGDFKILGQMAEKILTNLAKPNDAREHEARGWAYLEKRDYDRAISDSQEAIRLDSKFVLALVTRGHAYLNKQYYDRALATFSEAISLDPNFAAARAARGRAYIIMSDYDRAIGDLTEAIRIGPKWHETYYYRGIAYSAKRDYDPAIADYSEAIRIVPKWAEMYDHRGNAYSGKKDYDRAIVDYSEAIRIDPTFAPAFNDRGIAYYYKKDYDRAIADYTETVRIEPSFFMAYRGRGLSYLEKKDYASAIADFTEAIRIFPRYAWAYRERGLSYLKKKDYDRAIADCTEAIRIDPQFLLAYLDRGIAWGEKQDYDRAIADFTEAIRIDPKTVPAYVNRSALYRKIGKTQLAVEDEQTVTKLRAERNP